MKSADQSLHPLNDRTLEEAVLGAALLEAPALRIIQESFGSQVDIFHFPAHQHVYRAILELQRKGLDVDFATVVNELQKAGCTLPHSASQSLVEVKLLV
ncbi:DnaB-like helicase N-terminal domain-containing protein [Hymenobacter sp. ASUV-10]|uniref:DnaB-like helicase N-terminal domain-containing protein n=1 Tax=Hymenobacter aranciens TaxID=3063996 RepID=A0ABT9BGC7_9BACT|nr:DnaB-like helicase N-terminal domain-containing protein [Hymenobacter sp. ASUV-10]MDO7877323.1 DnaB-like helicase N-terminal domain-containing protein [Hymenobacter sp. ASUV-10]